MEFVVALVALVVAALIITLILVRRRRRGARPAQAPSTAGTTVTTTPRGVPRGGLAGRIRSVFGREEGDPWAELEAVLVSADVGPVTSGRIVRDVRDRYAPGADPARLVAEEIETILGGSSDIDLPGDRLCVLLVVGVNGSGKTTSIGKLAARFAREGKRVSIAGSDTFRAAANEQLEVWAGRAGAHLVRQARGADPGSVAFDAVRAAQARGSDVLIVDTAGRLHTKQPLMEELKKVRRVIEKAMGRAPDETLLVLDATTGQNGIAQARAFTEAVEVSGVVLTKLDGTAKGGVVLAVRDQLGVPVKVVGTGESVDDLQPFDAASFSSRLLDG